MNFNMIYIKKIILENFQSHKYTELEFDYGLNVIVGPSDQGKTAIIRALKWALFNEPSGDFFIREGENECSVTVVFSNGIKLKRYRSKTKNYYHLYDNSGQEIVYEGFGTKVPQEIIDKISLRKVLLDENRPNLITIGEQLEGPFLLSEKSSTRANAIGRLVGVHIIDDALKDTLKDNRNLNMKKKSLEESVEKLTASLLEYEYLDDLIIKANKLNEIKNEIYNKQLRLNELLQKKRELEQVTKEIKSLEIYINKLKNLDIIANLEIQLSDKVRKYKYIFAKYESLNIVKNNIKYNENVLLSLRNIDMVEDQIKRLNLMIDKNARLNSILNKYNAARKEIFLNKNILSSLKGIDSVEKNLNLISTKYDELIKMHELKSKFDNINKNISIGKVYIDKLSNIDLITRLKDYIECKYNLLLDLLSKKKNYDLTQNEISMVISNLQSLKDEMNNYLEQYRRILNNIKICPLCFSHIGKENIETIIQNYQREEIH